MDKCVIVITSIRRNNECCFKLPIKQDYGRNHAEVLDNFMMQFYGSNEVSFNDYFTENIILYVNKEECLLHYPNTISANLRRNLKESGAVDDILTRLSTKKIYAAPCHMLLGLKP